MNVIRTDNRIGDEFATSLCFAMLALPELVYANMHDNDFTNAAFPVFAEAAFAKPKLTWLSVLKGMHSQSKEMTQYVQSRQGSCILLLTLIWHCHCLTR
jgi:hypothetical protein